MPTTIKKTEEILDILTQACSRKELLILATPFLRFESTFVALQDKELHVTATMSREDVLYGLQTPDLTLRFPFGLGFYEANSRMLGLGLFQGRPTVRLALPQTIQENDQRVAYRVERVGRIPATFSTSRSQLYTATLGDISVSGARLHADRDLEVDGIQPGEELVVSIPITEDFRFDTHASVRHIRTRTLGLEFSPALDSTIQEPLSRWIFVRREEERERIARRLEQALPDLGHEAQVPHRGILLVSSDARLEGSLRTALKDVQPLHRVSPSTQALKDGLATHPVLVILHVPGLRLDDRRRLRSLSEQVGHRAPLLMLGTDLNGADLFELSTELKATSTLVWSEGRAAFFERLVQGIIRRHRSGGDSPLAPKEG